MKATSQVGVVLTSLSKGQFPSLEEMVNDLLTTGISTVEVPYRLPVNGKRQRISELSGRETRDVLDQLGRLGPRSMHGPIGNFFLTNAEVRETVTHSIRTCIQEAALIGAHLVVLHVEPSFPNLDFHGWGKGNLPDQLRDLADFASCYGLRVGMETQYPYTIRDFVGLIDEVDHPSFGATLDVGHLFDRRVPQHTYIDMELLRSPEGPAAYNSLLQDLTHQLLTRNKLFHVHLHQHRQEALVDPWPYGSCDHWALDQGLIDIPSFMDLLGAAGYQELIICELARGAAGGKAGSITREEILNSVALAKEWWTEALKRSA